jgi:hypothetical protein
MPIRLFLKSRRLEHVVATGFNPLMIKPTITECCRHDLFYSSAKSG